MKFVLFFWFLGVGGQAGQWWYFFWGFVIYFYVKDKMIYVQMPMTSVTRAGWCLEHHWKERCCWKNEQAHPMPPPYHTHTHCIESDGLQWSSEFWRTLDILVSITERKDRAFIWQELFLSYSAILLLLHFPYYGHGAPSHTHPPHTPISTGYGNDLNSELKRNCDFAWITSYFQALSVSKTFFIWPVNLSG